jgi:hypothetical protein
VGPGVLVMLQTVSKDLNRVHILISTQSFLDGRREIPIWVIVMSSTPLFDV